MSENETATRNQRRVMTGVVVSDKMDKTITVRVAYTFRHPKYGKYVRCTKHLKAHDETNDARAGDTVRIMETRKLSKDKYFRLLDVVERAPEL